ncbi:PaaI family thioesterase [Gordonia neofelifaecis]|uniref:Thioesterase family domain-containing protein n=1 Tax=Gordonia neofelifaecis NRRL B-59395 TaxID=644548 RepID=F1YP91_9ACTN|nr:PaaI family thioesterase [Gordonia neofelifaecis]EGD53486.1 thioesterase family domain-containing protein [Gordonia neofelifaecis NRRL B-59395]
MTEAVQMPGPSSVFMDASGLVITEASGSRVEGYADLDERHHTPFGVVHGGVYAAIVESAGSVGASAAVADRGQFSVGLNNSTDFLRSSNGCRARVVAEPIIQGRTQQLWLIQISDEATGKDLARGQLRLQNIALPTAD